MTKLSCDLNLSKSVIMAGGPKEGILKYGNAIPNQWNLVMFPKLLNHFLSYFLRFSNLI